MVQKCVDFDEKLKLTVIGAANVGKTCLTMRYCENKFNLTGPPPTYVDLLNVKLVEYNEKIYKLLIWDTQGMERRSEILRDALYEGTNGIIVTYDVTQRKTFDEVPFWLETARNRSGQDVSIVLVANKTDLDEMRAVSTAEGREIANQHDVLFIETSARENENVK